MFLTQVDSFSFAKKRFFKDKDLVSILSFLLGLTCTFQAFKYDVSGVHLYPFNLFYYSLLFVLFLVCFKRRTTIQVSSNLKILYLVLTVHFAIIILSGFIPIADGAEAVWIFASLKGSIKFLILLCFFTLLILLSDDLKVAFSSNFLKGFIGSIIIQSLYATAQLIFWYSFRIDLNPLIFYDLLKIDPGYSWSNFAFYPVIRTTGLHWDPAYLGVWSLIGIVGVFFIWKNSLLKKCFLSLMFLIFIMTFSRAAFFVLIMILIIAFSVHTLRILYKMKFKIKPTRVFEIVQVVLLTSFIILWINHYVVEGDIYKAIKIRASLEDPGSVRHLSYFRQGFYTISTSISKLLFGFGYRNGGRGLLSNPSVVNALSAEILRFKIPWSPEADFVNSYLELGLLGLLSYLSIWVLGALFLRSARIRLSRLKIDESTCISMKRKITFFLICYGILFFAGFFYGGYKDAIWFWILVINSFFIDVEIKKSAPHSSVEAT